MRRCIFHILLFALPCVLTAKNVVIKGTAKGFAKAEIAVFSYSDYITFTKQKLAFTSIGADQQFELNLNVSRTEKLIIEIDDKSVSLFAEPGKVYSIYLYYDAEVNKSNIYNKKLSLAFPFPVEGELNNSIMEFNKAYDTFLDKNMLYLVKRDRQKMSKSLKEFRAEIGQQKRYTQQAFVQTYVTYALAQLEAALRIAKKDSSSDKPADPVLYLYNAYFKNQAVQLHHPEYMQLFHEMFSGRFETIRLEKGMILLGALQEQMPLQKITHHLKQYPYFQNDTLLGLFFLKGINELYNQKQAPKKYLLQILDYYRSETPVLVLRSIAENVHKRLTNPALKSGVQAPAFTLLDKEGKSVALSDFAGKYVYIGFWATWSIPSIKEMAIISQFKKKYGHKVTFVSISVDSDVTKMTRFLEKYPFDWVFLHYGTQKEIKEQFFVRTVPTYVLINPDGTIAKAPAPRPTGNAERPTEESLEKVLHQISQAK